MTNHNLNHHDPESEALINQLDALASEDQQIPDARFEQRMLDAISDQIAPAPLSISTNGASSRPFVMGWKFNIAAAFIVVASVSLLLWTSTSVSTQPLQAANVQQTLVSLEEDFDALFELANFADDLDSDMDELDLMTDAMQTELAMPSVLIELSETSLMEGSL
jgi:hypothetical protein